MSSKNIFEEYSNEFSLFFLIIICYIVFHIPIENIFDKYFVENIFKHIYAKKWYNDLIFIFCIIYFSRRAYLNWKKQYYFNKPFSILFSICFIYLINRFLTIWKFHSTLFCESIYYFDLIIFLSFLGLILIIKTFFEKKSNKIVTTNNNEELGFLTDKPIFNIEDDKLEYSNYANTIANKILLTESEKSFAIGINGKWGVGKTSFFNLIKKKIEIRKAEIITINFYPWNTESPRAIMTDFFETLEDNLNIYNSTIPKKVSKYSEKLLTLNEIDNVKTFYNLFSQFLNRNKTLNELKNELEKSLEKLNKKIIVFIDDLDRLDDDEIIEVLRLIRNTANFKNTFFIVAYDRNYVQNALTNHNSYNKEGYLEKIFQIEINLPMYDTFEIKKQFFSNITSYFPEKKNIFQKIILDQNNYEINEIIEENVISIRDVIILTNSLILNYENLRGNVDFKDLLLLEILRIKYSKVYDILKTRNSQFIFEKHQQDRFYQLKYNNGSSEYKLFHFLDLKPDNFEINSLSTEKVKKIITLLFGNQTNYLSLQNISKYENYFSYRLSQKTLDENEFLDYLNKDSKIIQSKIDEWISKGFEFDLLKRFYAVNKYKDFNDYKKNIQNILYLSEQKSINSEKHIGFDFERIYLLFSYNRKVFEKINIDFTSFKEFIISLFNTKQKLTEFKSELLFNLINNEEIRKTQNGFKFSLSENELLTISEGYLDNYIHRNKKLKKDFYIVLKSNAKRKVNYSNSTENNFNNKITEKVISYFDTQTIDNLIMVILEKKFENSYGLNKEIIDLFKNPNMLINYLNRRKDNDKSKFYLEFKNFYETLSPEKKYSAISFEFEKIPI